MPKVVVLIGSVVALVGLFLVVSPSGGGLDLLGLLFAAGATVGCAIYYVVAAQQSDDLPPVALAASGLVLGAIALGLVSLTRLVPFTMTFGDLPLFGTRVPWFVPLLIVGVFATGIAYAANITASEILGSRLASFTGLLEVIAAAFYAWLLLGEDLSAVQLIGGILILAGIAFVRAEKADELPTPTVEVQLTEVVASRP
jgi:drug/metabolite transporter (DMT)-like permease